MDVDPATGIGEALLEAFKLIWEMYDEALENIPGEHWRAGEIDYLIPARQVYHAVETADFYSGTSPDDFPWGQRFDGGCFDSPPEELPTREQAREYHDEVRMKVTDWIRGLDAPGILAREEVLQLKEFVGNGAEIPVIVGAEASPSCGVTVVGRWKKWVPVSTRKFPQDVDFVPGRGVYMEELEKLLNEKGIEPAWIGVPGKSTKKVFPEMFRETLKKIREL